jgi:hypothetical protein
MSSGFAPGLSSTSRFLGEELEHLLHVRERLLDLAYMTPRKFSGM